MKAKNGEPMRFFNEVLRDYEGDDCIRWPYAKTIKGYGQFWVEGKIRIVSRYLCEAAHGAPPTDRHQASHLCGNGHLGCVNKSHLVWMTPRENEHHKKETGTYHIRGGPENLVRADGLPVRAKLTEAQVVEILTTSHRVSTQEFAERFGVGKHAIYDIKRGRNWKWVHDRVVKHTSATELPFQ